MMKGRLAKTRCPGAVTPQRLIEKSSNASGEQAAHTEKIVTILKNLFLQKSRFEQPGKLLEVALAHSSLNTVSG